MGESIVKISPNQQVSDSDLNRIGEFARDSLDHVVKDAVGAGQRYTGFQSLQTAAAQVTVGAGRFYDAEGKVYGVDTATVLDLITILPAVTKRVVTVVAWGVQSDAQVEPRTFLVDVQTRATQGQETATEVRRLAQLGTVAGVEAADPKAPAIDANVIAVADVVLTPAGVESVTMRAANKLPSVGDNTARLADLDAWRGRAGSRLDVLDTNLAGVTARLAGLAPVAMAFELARDVARLKELAELPATYSSYDADRFLNADKSDTAHPDFLCLVEEGIRFAPAAVATAQLGLANPLDPSVAKRGDFILPAFAEVERIKMDGKDDELSLSQYQYQTTQVVQKTRSRERVRFGSSMTPCTNSAWWQSGQYDPVTGIMRRDGETWIVAAEDRDRALINHQFVRVTQFWTDTYQEEYWDAVTVTEGVNGSVVSQTFLNSESGWITGISLPFTRVADTGDVTLLIVETEGGKPDAGRTIAKVTVPAADLKTYPTLTKISLPPTYVEKGTRLAFTLITPGNHFIATVTGNKNTNGSLFYSTDGAWFQGDVLKDIPFTLYFAQFSTPRLEVQLQPLALVGGIASIDINHDAGGLPAGTERHFEVQLADGSWQPLKSYAETLITGLPALLQLRIVLLGTVDVMPGFSVGASSQVKTSRPRTDFKHVATVHHTPAPVNTVTVTARLEGYDEVRHDCVADLLVGAGFATVETADVVTDQPTPDPSAIVRTWTFNLAAARTDYKIRFSATTNNALVTFHVAERYDLAFA